MSNTRIMRSTPPVAITLPLYLFQSCVSASEGAQAGCNLPGIALDKGAPWIGICIVRWLLALAGVRKSQTRKCESEQTALRTPSVCGLHCVLYVQEWVGNVSRLCCLSGFHIFTDPSQEDDANVAFEVRFQLQEKASRVCS
jgi:hypothetical protein